MVIPSWLNTYINAEEIQSLERQISQIESRCDVEIVPVIVRSSSHYPQTPITLSLLWVILFIEMSSVLNIEWGWDGQARAVGFGIVFILGLFLLIPWLSRFPKVKMWMTHRSVEEEQCWKRAEIEFYSERVTQTKKDNGILLFISLLERRVIIKGDSGIAEKLDSAVWKRAVESVVDATRQKKMAQGIEHVLQEMESLLIKCFPVTSGRENEIPNTFTIKE